MNEALAEEMLKLLRERKLEAKDVAKAAGISKQYFCDIVKCRKNPRRDTLRDLEDAFGVRRNRLFNISTNLPRELILWIHRAPGVRALLYRIKDNQLDADEVVNLERG
jgi:transcriptional regulator with XRE-family HTH domain